MKALQLFDYTANNFVKQDLFFGYDMLCFRWNMEYKEYKSDDTNVHNRIF